MRRFALRIKFIVKTSTGFWWRGDGVRGEPALAFLFCSAKTPPQNTPTVAPRKAHSSPSRSKSCRPNAAAAVKYIGAQQPRTPILLSEAAAGHRCSEAAIPIPLAQCMRSRAVVPRTKLTPLADAYRSVVCTYLCAALLWRVLATVLETCSLSELLKGRAIRAVPPQLFTASYKTCHKHGTRRRH